MQKESAKQKIKELVEKYEQVVKTGQLKKYSEEETKKDFILPLFEALGWNTFDKKEVSAEESIKSAGRVDYGFYLNGRPKFYLETKALKADLHKPEYANQAIRYSWNKGVSWSVLTDFESVKVFNAEAISKYLFDKMFFEVPYSEFTERFDQLWFLSKESFEQDLIDKEAVKLGKKMQKVPVGKKLYEDLNDCRDILTRVLAICNPKVNKDLLDEGIQKLLDRLIFLRVAEDREIEKDTLKSLMRQWKDKGVAYNSMVDKFRELDKIYNSNLFTEHPFEKWEDYAGATEKVLKKLYGQEGYYEYDFKVMAPDVLGGVYESYLGHRLSQSKKGFTLAKDAKKRKEQGIYYTPDFIVDYIVKNALKPILDKCGSVNDLRKIKVLDPACGSGSFLIKALEVIYDKYKEFNNTADESTLKLTILMENIYGVDLDEQAVEITQLNLLINALCRREKFPRLDHIKNGNSLISGTDEELKRYFGKNFRDKKPFNWQEEFPEVFRQGGFDVIIGNPPYVVLDSDDESAKFFKHNFESSKGGKINLYKLFIEKSISILKDGGGFGFICPSNYISSKDSVELRRLLLNETNLIEITEYVEKDKVFTGVTQALTTLIFKKSKNKNNSLRLITSKHGGNFICQDEFLKNDGLEFVFENKIISKIQEHKNKIYNLAECYQGEINVSTKKDLFISVANETTLPLLRGNLIKNYSLTNTPNEYCPISADKRKHFLKSRVVFQEVSNQQQKRRIKATIVKNMLCGHTTNYCFPKISDADIYLILALLNSNLLNYYFSYFNNTNHVPVGEIKETPIPNFDKNNQKILSELAKKMLDLNKELQKTPENSNKWNSIKSEIKKTDKKIDEEVYKLYGLTEKEIRIIEEK